MHFKKYASVM